MATIEEIRAAFPALERRHEGFPVADLDGPVRIGCACYTTENEVDRVIDSLRAIARGHD